MSSVEDDLLVWLQVVEVISHQLRDDDIGIVAARTYAGIAVLADSDRDAHVRRSRNENSIVRCQHDVCKKWNAVIGFERARTHREHKLLTLRRRIHGEIRSGTNSH